MSARTPSVPKVATETTIQKSQPKTESTPVTYGQSMIYAAPARTTSASTTAQAKSGATPRAISPSVGTAAIMSNRSPVSKKSPFVATPPTKLIFQKPRIIPQDTIVKVVRKVDELETAVNQFGEISNLPCKTKSDIAVAAVSTNKSATVVLPSKMFVRSEIKTNTLAGVFLADFSKTTPKMEEHVLVRGSVIKTKAEQKEVLIEAQKIDLAIALKSGESESVELNMLKVPDLEVDLVYNFFIETEEDIELEEDPTNDPLRENKPISTPRYIELQWNTVNVTERLTGTEKEVDINKNLRRNVFMKKRGVISHRTSNFRDSVEKKRKRFIPLNQDGIKKKLIDIHNVEKGFETIANHKTFSNSISVTVSSQFQKNTMNELPILSLRKI